MHSRGLIQSDECIFLKNQFKFYLKLHNFARYKKNIFTKLYFYNFLEYLSIDKFGSMFKERSFALFVVPNLQSVY
jgi:hypothetical protein